MENTSEMTKEQAQQAFQEIINGLERLRVEIFTGSREQSERAKVELVNSMMLIHKLRLCDLIDFDQCKNAMQEIAKLFKL
jgi:hypothetical protein